MEMTPLVHAIVIPLLLTLAVAGIAIATASFLFVRRAVVLVLSSIAPVLVVVHIVDFSLHFAAEGFAAFGERGSSDSRFALSIFYCVVSLRMFPEVWKKHCLEPIRPRSSIGKD